MSAENNLQPLGVTTTFNQIAAHGDPVSALKRLTHNDTLACGVAGGVTGAAISAFNTLPDTDSILTMPAYCAAGYAVGTVLSRTWHRTRETKRFSKAQALQETIQTQFEQPVDIINFRPKKGYSSQIRWYGFDIGYHDDNFSPLAVFDEFKSLIDVAKKNNLSRIIVSTSIFESLDSKDRPVDKYNQRSEKQWAVTIHNDSSIWPDIDDPYSDPKLAHLRIEDAEHLADKIQEKMHLDLGDQLMKRLIARSPHHPAVEAYTQWKARDNSNSKIALETVLKRAIEDRAQDVGGRTRTRSADGHGFVYGRVSSSHNLWGNRVLATQTILDGGAEAKVSVDSLNPLFAHFDSRSVDELLSKIDHAPQGDKSAVAQIEAALWYIVGPHSNNTIATYQLQTFEGNRRPLYPSLSARIAQEPPRTFPYLRHHGKGTTTEESSVRYERFNRSALRIGTLVAAGVISVTPLFMAQALSNNVNTHYDETAAELAARYPDTTIDADAVQNNILENKNPRSLYYAGLFKLTDFNNGIQNVLVDTADKVGVKGIVEHLVPQAEPESATSSTIAQNVHAIGDAGSNTDLNQPLWNLRGTGGATTEGFWSQQVLDTVVINPVEEPADATVPFMDREVVLVESTKPDVFLQAIKRTPQKDIPLIEVSPSQKLEIPDQQKMLPPAFDIDGNPISLSQSAFSNASIPVLDGKTIDAAQVEIYDKDNRSKGVQSVYIGYSNNGTQHIFFNIQNTTVSDTFTLTYWLRDGGKMPYRAHATGSMEVADSGRDGGTLNQVMSYTQAEDIWQALPGMQKDIPLDINSEYIAYEVNDQHTYSVAPLKAGKLKKSLSGANTSSGDVLRAFGVSLASNPEANCNTAAFQTLLMTQGIDKNRGELNPVTGYYNGGNDNLSSGEAHMMLTDQSGKYTDATPTEIAVPPKEKMGIGEKAIIGFAVGAPTLLLGSLGAMMIAEKIARRRQKKATQTLNPAVVEDPNQESDEVDQTANHYKHITLLKALLYAGPQSEEQLQRAEKSTRKIELDEHYKHLPALEPKDVRRILRDLQKDGHYTLSKTEESDFMNFIKNLHRMKATV